LGFKPLDRANKFRISVSEMTPVKRPLKCAPGSAAAGTDCDGEKTAGDMGCGEDGADVWIATPPGCVAPPGAGVIIVAPCDGDAPPPIGGTAPDAAPVFALAVPPPPKMFDAASGPRRGVAGALGEGLADSTTHIRCERVATSLATVAARVE